MNNTSAIKGRMKSIRQTVQIANATKLIAASRIGRAKRMLAESEPYHDRIRQHIAEILALCPDAANCYLDRSSKGCQRRGLLVITSDKGLAGGLNSNLIKAAEHSLRLNPAERLVVIGNIGRNHFINTKRDFIEIPDLQIVPPSIFAAREIAERISEFLNNDEVDGFDIVYTHFTSTVRTAPNEARLFPFSPEDFGDPAVSAREVAFEPSPDSVLSMLMPKYLYGFIYGCLVHSWASELAARVMAMDSAIRNGNEMLDMLSLAFNRARQAMITQEITEIVAGAAAMIEE